MSGKPSRKAVAPVLHETQDMASLVKKLETLAACGPTLISVQDIEGELERIKNANLSKANAGKAVSKLRKRIQYAILDAENTDDHGLGGLPSSVLQSTDSTRECSEYMSATNLPHLPTSIATSTASSSRVPSGRAAPVSNQPTDHQPTDHQPTDHRPTDHRPTDHRPTDHRPTDHRPTDHRPTDHRPTDHRPDHRPTHHQPTDHPSTDPLTVDLLTDRSTDPSQLIRPRIIEPAFVEPARVSAPSLASNQMLTSVLSCVASSVVESSLMVVEDEPAEPAGSVVGNDAPAVYAPAVYGAVGSIGSPKHGPKNPAAPHFVSPPPADKSLGLALVARFPHFNSLASLQNRGVYTRINYLNQFGGNVDHRPTNHRPTDHRPTDAIDRPIDL